MPFLVAYLLVWGGCLALYPLHVSWSMNPHVEWLAGVIAASFSFMVVGYCAAAFFSKKTRNQVAQSREWLQDDNRILRFQLVLVFLALFDLAIAIVIDGAPPGLGAFGLSTKFYLTYASGIIGPLAPLLNLLFLSAYYNERPSTRWALRVFVVFVFLLVALRGPLIMLLFQYAAMILINNRHRWRSWLVLRAAILTSVAAGFVLVEIMDLGSLLRGSTISSAFTYLKIANTFRAWPFGVVLVLLYATQPASSFLWMMQADLAGAAGLSGLNQVIPRLFRGDQTLFIDAIPGVVDGVATYLAPIYLSLGWPGIFAEHLLLGLLCYVFSRKGVMDRMPMFGALLLCQIAFSTFADLFLALTNLLGYVLIFLFYRVCFQRGFFVPRLLKRDGAQAFKPA
jgi:oligosaccharide repeat unit polymerase